MNIGIVYASRTGNTKSLAIQAAEQLKNLSHSVSILTVEEFIRIPEVPYDLLLIGSYCDSSTFTRSIRDLFQNLKQNRCLAVFVTHATCESGPYYDKWGSGCEKFYKDYCKEQRITDKGFFHCRAKPSAAIGLFVKICVFRHDKAGWKAYKKDMGRFPGTVERLRFEEFIDSLFH